MKEAGYIIYVGCHQNNAAVIEICVFNMSFFSYAPAQGCEFKTEGKPPLISFSIEYTEFVDFQLNGGFKNENSQNYMKHTPLLKM